MSRVQEIFASVVAEGFRAETAHGATDDEIDRMAVAQGVSTVPASLREVLRLLGRDPALWLSGAIFGVNSIDAQVKQDALDGLDDAEDHAMRDPQNLLVVVDAGDAAYLMVDGADLGHPDPPLWLLDEDGTVQKRWAAITDWFRDAADRVLEGKARLVSRRELGSPDLAREAYFEWPWSR